jgi:cellulose synthase/poly-beta-1,6-N-acetylglucosamine synthase-like glycosyltransferase
VLFCRALFVFDMQWPTILWLCCYTFVVVGLSAFGIHRWFMVGLFWKNLKNPPVPKGRFETLPLVTVQLPIYNEQMVVSRLVKAVAALDYPKELLEIQILDDSTDETKQICEAEAARLKAEGYDVVLLHREDRTGFKAGALEKGMACAKGDFLFILDADFVPSPGVIHEMIHFFTDEKIGMIQTRWGHINRDYNILTKAQALFLDGHLVVEQVARSRTGRFFNFNGTAGIWRKQTIIDAGGWDHDTLTEDLDLSYRAQMKGWKFIFLKDVISPAELPVDITGFKSQQFRWTKGSIQTCKKILGRVWRSDIPLLLKIEATVHLGANYAYFLMFMMFFLVIPGSGAEFTMGGWRGLLFDLPAFIFTTGSIGAFYLSSQIAAYPKKGWKNIIYLPVLLGLGIGMSLSNGKGVLEAMLGRESAFIRTPKYGIEKKGQKWQRAAGRPTKKLLLGFEIAFAMYFTGLVIFGILNKSWSSLPFLLMFAMGFWYVVAASFPQFFRNRQNIQPDGPAAV